jgi:hypothetical protein
MHWFGFQRVDDDVDVPNLCGGATDAEVPEWLGC